MNDFFNLSVRVCDLIGVVGLVMSMVTNKRRNGSGVYFVHVCSAFISAAGGGRGE